MPFLSPIAKSCALYCLPLLIHNAAVSRGMHAGVSLGQDIGVVADCTLFTPIRMSFRQLIERLLLIDTDGWENVLLPHSAEVLQIKAKLFITKPASLIDTQIQTHC